MKRASTSAYALTLPQAKSAVVIEIAGRQTIARPGIFITKIGRYRRMVYQQFTGETILADDCRCEIVYPALDEQYLNPYALFKVRRSPVCPIDQHRVMTHSFPTEAA